MKIKDIKNYTIPELKRYKANCEFRAKFENDSYFTNLANQYKMELNKREA